MTRLHIDIHGKGHPLIMLHGWGWHSGIWQPLLPQLQRKYQVFLIDLPGFGKSPALSNGYHFENIVPLLLEIAPPEAAWLGWSLGGLFAMWIAIYFPERVSHLITIASTPCFVRKENWPGIENATLEKFSQLLSLDHRKTLLDFLELQLRGSSQREQLFAELTPLLSPADQSSLCGALQLLQNTDLRSELKKISCESLHIFGQLDTIVPSRIAPSLSSMLPQSRSSIIRHTGHMPFLTHTKDVLDLVDGFLVAV